MGKPIGHPEIDPVYVADEGETYGPTTISDVVKVKNMLGSSNSRTLELWLKSGVPGLAKYCFGLSNIFFRYH